MAFPFIVSLCLRDEILLLVRNRLIKYLLLVCLFFPFVSFGQIPIEPNPQQKIAQKIAFVAYHSGFPIEIALPIAQCESELRQKRSNEMNKNGTYDWGVFQINDTHIKTARQMGYDVKASSDDNIQFAFKLFREEGVGPWSASKKCWLPKVALSTATPTKDV